MSYRRLNENSYMVSPSLLSLKALLRLIHVCVSLKPAPQAEAQTRKEAFFIGCTVKHSNETKTETNNMTVTSWKTLSQRCPSKPFLEF